MGYVAAGYIAVFSTVILYSAWTILRSQRAAQRVLETTKRTNNDE